MGVMANSEQSIPVDTILGAALRHQREAAHIAQSVLAKAARGRGFHWSQTTVSHIESGSRPLSANELIALPYLLDDCLPAGRGMSFGLTFVELLDPGPLATLHVGDGLELTGPEVNALLGLYNDVAEER
jgi:hypothetical protein